jgi:hypothetical protein
MPQGMHNPGEPAPLDQATPPGLGRMFERPSARSG